MHFSYNKPPEEGKAYFGHRVGGTQQYLVLKQSSEGASTAFLTGADEFGDQVALSEGYTLYRNPSSTPRRRGPPPGPAQSPTLGVFVIELAASYELWFSGQLVLSIQNHRQQQINMHGVCLDLTSAYHAKD